VNVKDDCSNFNELPNLGFQLGNKVLNLKPDDYVDRDGSSCSFSLMALDVPPPKGPVFIFGDPFLRRFVTIFDRAKSRVGFAVAKNGDNANPNELIATVGSSASENDSSSEAAGSAQSGAVDLHLDSGLMGGDGSSSSDDSSSSADQTTTTQAPVQAFKPSDDNTQAATDQAMSEALSGEASMSGDDSAPPATTTTTTQSAVSDDNAFNFNAAADTAATSSMDNQFNFNAADTTQPPASDSPASTTTEAYQAAAAGDGDAWFHAGEDASTTAAPVVADATTTPSTGGYGDIAADYFNQPEQEATTTGAPVDASEDTTAAPAVTTTPNAVESMRRMLAGSLLQKSKKGTNNLVSVKLHRY